jgi:methyl-accepting chemotaxis protein
MEQMSANIEQNVENAKNADKIAKKSAFEIEYSSNEVKTTAKSMDEIAKKTSIIGDIAFQVNILALNAAVEAARAGVHGKGFGVVANEVGKLADRSKLAALEIDQLTNKSFITAKASGLSLEKIVPEIKKTADLVQDITKASIEQQSGTEQINNAIQQLNNVTQQNAASAEHLATNVETLTMLADKLNKLIAFFKIEEKSRKLKGEKNEPFIEFSSETKQKGVSEKELSSDYAQNLSDESMDSEKKEIDNEKLEKNDSTFTQSNKEYKEPQDKLIKRKPKGYDLDLGLDEFPDDGFEKF